MCVWCVCLFVYARVACIHTNSLKGKEMCYSAKALFQISMVWRHLKVMYWGREKSDQVKLAQIHPLIFHQISNLA